MLLFTCTYIACSHMITYHPTSSEKQVAEISRACISILIYTFTYMNIPMFTSTFMNRYQQISLAKRVAFTYVHEVYVKCDCITCTYMNMCTCFTCTCFTCTYIPCNMYMKCMYTCDIYRYEYIPANIISKASRRHFNLRLLP